MGKRLFKIAMSSLSIMWVVISMGQLCYGIYKGDHELVTMATKILSALLLPGAINSAQGIVANASLVARDLSERSMHAQN